MLGLNEQQIYESLLKLGRLHVLHYVPRKSTPYIYYTTSRELPKHVDMPKAVYEVMKQRLERRIEAMKSFVYDDAHCRVAGMLRYFGEPDAPECGKCDVCRAKKKKHTSGNDDIHRISEGVLYLSSQPGGHTTAYMAAQLGVRADVIIPVIRTLIDEEKISIGPDGNVTRRLNG